MQPVSESGHDTITDADLYHAYAIALSDRLPQWAATIAAVLARRRQSSA